ncbi:hypothetical protein [Haloechinothrix halophila]|uniref:hypothetical protein n=1 Tax=Haloechinothrix halophila TaxID=1069073 RepID=UPI0003FD2393|nr:hypothetical protein [Haloechinothrix halophila]
MNDVKPQADAIEQERPAITIVDGDSLDDANLITSATLDANPADVAEQRRLVPTDPDGVTDDTKQDGSP